MNKIITWLRLENNKLSAIQFSDAVNIKGSNLSKDMLEEEAISELISSGFTFDKKLMKF